MPREGTKTFNVHLSRYKFFIEIRYAPGGDENSYKPVRMLPDKRIEIRYAPGGDENPLYSLLYVPFPSIEIRYAPGGDENPYIIFIYSDNID